MAKKRSQDNFVAYVAAGIVVILVGVFLFTWIQSRTAAHSKPEVAYSQFGPLTVESQNLTVQAALAVQTSTDNAKWPERNKESLAALFAKTLAGADLKILKEQNGLQALQDKLNEQCHATFKTGEIQTVLLTDFIYQPN